MAVRASARPLTRLVPRLSVKQPGLSSSLSTQVQGRGWLYQARERATAAGMVGMVAAIDLRIAETIEMRNGPVAAYPTFRAADTQARQLRLMGLYAHTRVHIAECLINADDRPLPGRTQPAAPSEVDDLIAEALAVGEKSKPVRWAKLILGMRAWLHGDSRSAIELFDQGLRYLDGEVHVMPGWGCGHCCASWPTPIPRRPLAQLS
jgi:hypothetical protein